MLTANTLISGNIVSVIADDAAYLGGTYHCPSCKSEVTLKNGYVRIPHFAHKAAASCEYAGESMLHIKMKLQIFQNLNATIKNKVLVCTKIWQGVSYAQGGVYFTAKVNIDLWVGQMRLS